MFSGGEDDAFGHKEGTKFSFSRLEFEVELAEFSKELGKGRIEF